MIRVPVETLGYTPDELRRIVARTAKALEASERWPSEKVQLELTEAPEDDPDRASGTWYYAKVTGLPRGATLYSESKGLPHSDLALGVENESDAVAILAALREGFAAFAGPLEWLEPAAFPEEWSRLESEMSAVLGVQRYVPDRFLFTESFLGLSFGYAFVEPGKDPLELVRQGGHRRPALAAPRHAIPVGPVPPGKSASSLVTKSIRLPEPDEILAAFLGDGAKSAPRLERIASGAGSVLPFALPQPDATVALEPWAAGPWRIRIGRASRRDDERFQIAIQHLQGGERALFASSSMDPWKEKSLAVTAAATAPAQDEAGALVKRMLARIGS